MHTDFNREFAVFKSIKEKKISAFDAKTCSSVVDALNWRYI